MNVLFSLTQEEVYTNARLKVNPKTGEIMECLVASRPIFKVQAVEERSAGSRKPRRGPLPGAEIWETEEASAAMGDIWEAEKLLSLRRAANRAKRQVFDLAACNDFDLFITLTLNKEKIDRYDYKAAVKKLSQWLDNRVRRKGLRYVIVPEYHKDGAIHFHGLINSEAVKLVDSGKKDRKNGKHIYNVADWTLGFTTAEYLSGEYAAVCHYISKYVTKQVSHEGPIGGRYYLHGGELAHPVYKPFSVSFDGADGREFDIPQAGLTLKYVEVGEAGKLYAADKGDGSRDSRLDKAFEGEGLNTFRPCDGYPGDGVEKGAAHACRNPQRAEGMFAPFPVPGGG